MCSLRVRRGKRLALKTEYAHFSCLAAHLQAAATTEAQPCRCCARYLLYEPFLLAGAAGPGRLPMPNPTNRSPVTLALAPSAPAVPNSPGCSYEAFRGLLPGQADSITLFVVRSPAPNTEFDNGNYTASYCSDNGRPYDLSPEITHASDSLCLIDTDYETLPAHGGYGDGPRWRLRRQPGGSLQGTYAGRPLRLRPARPAPGG